MEKVYWDSVCFLTLFNEEAKVDLCKDVLQLAEQGKIRIVTSAFTLVEVLHIKNMNKIPKTKSKIVEQFFDNEYIEIKNLDRRISENARILVWEKGISPKDACHVATATFFKMEKLHTFDKYLLKKSGQVGNPKLIIEEPSVQQTNMDI